MNTYKKNLNSSFKYKRWIKELEMEVDYLTRKSNKLSFILEEICTGIVFCVVLALIFALLLFIN